MKKVGLVLGVVVAALALWLGWEYYDAGQRIRDITSRLPSDETLQRRQAERDFGSLSELLNLARIQCRRVSVMRESELTRTFRKTEISNLSDRCERLARFQESITPP
jgi:hypothetical protein